MAGEVIVSVWTRGSPCQIFKKRICAFSGVKSCIPWDCFVGYSLCSCTIKLYLMPMTVLVWGLRDSWCCVGVAQSTSLSVFEHRRSAAGCGQANRYSYPSMVTTSRSRPSTWSWLAWPYVRLAWQGMCHHRGLYYKTWLRSIEF